MVPAIVSVVPIIVSVVPVVVSVVPVVSFRLFRSGVPGFITCPTRQKRSRFTAGRCRDNVILT